MAEVVYQPRKKVIIHEYSKYESINQLAEIAFRGVPPGGNVTVKWANGIVLTHSAWPMTDTVIRELLKGNLHWDHMSFAPMETYQPTLYIDSLRLTVNIIDVSYNEVFISITDFIINTFFSDDSSL